MNTIGERIIFLRENMDLSQVKLAALINISKMTLYKYEKNVCEPRGEIIARLADVLNTTTDYLLGRTNDYSPLIKDSEMENKLTSDAKFLKRYRSLNQINQAKVMERMELLIEEQND